jgi:hypothetical protein
VLNVVNHRRDCRISVGDPNDASIVNRPGSLALADNLREQLDSLMHRFGFLIVDKSLSFTTVRMSRP